MSILKFEYKNYKGERKIRSVEPVRIFYGKTPNITENEWILEGYDQAKQSTRQFAMRHIQRMVDEGVQRFFCVMVFVIDVQERLLMIHHNKLNKWCPPGGKVDNNATPDSAVFRECFEETGIKIELICDLPNFEGALITPMGSQCNVIKLGECDHVDLTYIVKPINTDFKIAEGKASDIG